MDPDVRSGAAEAGEVRRPRVLVVGTDQWAIDQAAARLADDGYPVLRCHEPGEPSFPCNAMRAGRVCPMDAGAEVVLDVRTRPSDQPTLGEIGALCGLRHGCRIVVAGPATSGGFGAYADAVVHNRDELTDAVCLQGEPTWLG